MTLRRLALTTLLVVAIPIPGTASAQTIAGRVLDDLSEAPISAATILLLDSMDTAVARAESDSVGRFFMSAPGAGVYRLFADRLAYGKIRSEAFPLQDAGTVELLVRMVPLPIELDEFVVTAERRQQRLDTKGFYRRQRASMGHFFDIEDIQAWDPLRVTDVIRNVPGVIVRRSRLGGLVALTQRFGRQCAMKVVLDGFKVDVVDGSLDSLVDPARVIGIEVYPSGVGAPIEHRGRDSRCGIMMIWTR